MQGWGYVLLAYGVVWTAIALYLASLKGRLRKARAKLASKESAGKNAA